MFNIHRCSACCRPSRIQITFNRFSTIFEVFVPHFIHTALIASSLKAFWIIQIVSAEECSSFMQNLLQIFCSTHSVIFECNGYPIHMLTQWHLPPLLTSTVKLSLFTHVHSSPLSLTARLHGYHANHSDYINNGWTFSRQTSYTVKNEEKVTIIFSFLMHFCRNNTS